MDLIYKYLGEGVVGPTRMQIQNEVDKLRKINKSIGDIKREVEKMFKLKSLQIRNDGTVVNFELSKWS